MSLFRIALYQNESHLGNPTKQLAQLEDAVRKVSKHNVNLMIFPELYMSGYNVGSDITKLAEPQLGSFMQNVMGFAKTTSTAIIYGYPEKDRNIIYNSAAIIDGNGVILGNYRKTHLIGSYELKYFTRGNEFVRVKIGDINVSPLICYDVEFAEAVRSCALSGAELIVVPTALKIQWLYLTQTLIPTRSFENGVFLAYSNFCGSENDDRYCGYSCVAGPDGKIIKQADSKAQTLIVDIDKEMITKDRSKLPYLEDRRPEIYGNF